MRQTQIFSGSSHPALVEAICDRLGQKPAKAHLSKFSNGETNIQIQTSTRDQDVFIVQSGSSKINDAVMELLIMVSACKGGSSKSITAVMPYFPYSRQSKKKSHRGAITARMLANLLEVSGVNHVITIDLHASQMQGFFRCPVDNLVAEPLIAHWIKGRIAEWRQAVVVSKNPGGTKRVTSLADALKLDFGIVMTDRARPSSGRTSLNNSTIFPSHVTPKPAASPPCETSKRTVAPLDANAVDGNARSSHSHAKNPHSRTSHSEDSNLELARSQTAPSAVPNAHRDAEDGPPEIPNRDIITGRLVHGHIVDDKAPSSPRSNVSSRAPNGYRRHDSDDDIPEQMVSSVFSTTSSVHHGPDYGLGGSGDAVASSDDEEEKLMDPELESTVTFVGNVKDREVLIVDDMIDKSASWIAAAETVVKKGGATRVYCMATHGLFGGDCLREMEECECIYKVVVTNTFPILGYKAQYSTKLEVLDVSGLLSEAIRRNHHGESIHQLFVLND